MSPAEHEVHLLFIESWIEYGISMLFLSLRFFIRWRIFGLRNFDLGDAFAGAAVLFYTLSATGIYILSGFGTNVGLNEQTAMQVPDSMLASMELGSKLAFINWYWYITLLWSLKGVLIMVYVKLGAGIDRQELIIKSVCVFAIASWLGAMMCHTLVCSPPWKSWQVKPYAGDACAMRRPNYIVIAVLNGLSDLAIIAVPMPILFRVKVPLSRKLCLVALFSMGFFCIIATILRAYYSLHSLETLVIALRWRSREMCVGTLVACAPGIKPFFDSTNWYRSSSNDGSRDKLSRTSVSKYISFSKKPSCKGEFGDGTITVSRSVDVTHSEHKGSPDAYTMEMDRWNKHGSSSTWASDEGVIMDEDDPELKSKASHKSTQYSIREFFLSESPRSHDHI